MPAKQATLHIEKLVKTFAAGNQRIQALRGLSMQAEQGDFIAIMGPSGSGKSTLLHCIAGLCQADAGKIYLDGKLLANNNDRQMSALRRRKIGVIFQSFNLLPNLNIGDNICLPLYADGKKVERDKLHSLVERLGIADKLKRRPASLSGGEQQRAAIARALLCEPSLILADEPTGSLDSIAGNQFCELLRRLCEEEKRSILLVTHEPAVAVWAKKVLVLHDGQQVGELELPEQMPAAELAAAYSKMIA
ncbi:MAG: ABC transporter ATP-binding protein [Lentisphaeria bacterium]|nr:ABC transporter ATP-binding protein [Lentisphaeria bacterium]MDY0175576.1 ABC transporter ATP-binding protein [Lentisphaeria bacterium]NLZ59871.1 ABC transporter ATP-binding protein [Lentisphaerota bacterium]